MTEELFRGFVEHKLDKIDMERVAVESYNTTKELVDEMGRMCQALADFCEEHKFALNIAQVSLIIQGRFPGMDKSAPDNAGTIGFIWGSAKSTQENIVSLIHTHTHAQPHRIIDEED